MDSNRTTDEKFYSRTRTRTSAWGGLGVGGLIQNTHIIVGFKHLRSVYMRQVGHRKSCTTTRVCGRFPEPDLGQAGALQEPRNAHGTTHKDEGGEGGVGGGHRLCTGPACTVYSPPPTAGCPSQPPLSNLQQPSWGH